MIAVLLVSIVILIAALLIFRLNRRERKEIKKLINIRSSIARDLHDDIGATLSSISFSTQAVVQRIEQHKMQDALDILKHIGEDARTTVVGMSDIVWMVNPANDSFENLFTKISDYSKDICAANQIGIHFHNSSKAIHKIDLLKRRDIYFLCKEIINNAVKYAKAKNIHVNISIHQQNLQICIEDDGIGFDMESVKFGNGILNMKVRTAELGGEISINSIVNKGTSVLIKLPIQKLSE